MCSTFQYTGGDWRGSPVSVGEEDQSFLEITLEISTDCQYPHDEYEQKVEVSEDIMVTVRVKIMKVGKEEDVIHAFI